MTPKGWGAVGVLVAIVGTSGFVGAYRGRQPLVAAQPGYTTTATVKDLMDAIVDPSADDVWNAVKTTVDPGGVDETVPVTADDWANVRRGAIRLVESTSLLMMPGRHVGRPGEKSETPGVELEPQEMEALVNQDRAAWDRHAQALRNVSLEVLSAADAKDATKLFDAGGRLDATCETCHRQYWYPNERIPEFPANFDAPANPVAGK